VMSSGGLDCFGTVLWELPFWGYWSLGYVLSSRYSSLLAWT